MSISIFAQKKHLQEKIVLVSAHDFSAATILEESTVDAVLVGDSLAMTVHGFEHTTMATMQLMEIHTAAVARGLKKKCLISDMPFLSYRKSLSKTMSAVECLMRAGAHAIKLEGSVGNLDTIQHIVESGVPVMGHLGLTPQHVHQLGGYKVQGRHADSQQEMIKHALQLEKAGCFSIVLECIPQQLAKTISEELTIPTIGIGAGPHTDGQVLVWQDLLGMQQNFKPKYLKQYLSGNDLMRNAVNQYVADVKACAFPNTVEHCF